MTIITRTVCPECRTDIDAPAGQLTQCPGCNELIRPIEIKEVAGEPHGVWKNLQNRIDEKKGKQ